MNKRLCSVLLCALMLLSIAVPVFADEAQEETAGKEITISTADEFLTFAENCRLDSYSWNLTVSLEENIDLSGYSFQGIPIFSGTFQGNGHTVSGLSLTADGSQQGLFRYLTAEASVLDLTVHGEITPAGSRNMVGAIAGSNGGNILNCSFQGTVSGSEYVGGLVGKNTVTGVIEQCSVTGDIYGDHFVGGIAGENSGVIRGCTNGARINTTPQQNSVEISDITIDTLTNSEAANTVTDIGGIAGISSGVIRESENNGDVGYQHMGYNVGGIAGTQAGYIADCENYGSIQGRKEAGGIVGQMEPVTQIEFTEDTLQILQGQLNTMSGLVSSASGNAQSNAGQITTQIGKLQEQTKTAQDAIGTLFPEGDDMQLPDSDTILAAQNTLSKTMDSMPKTLKKIASATQSTVSGLSRDLNAISSQINAMSRTISGASENLGGTVTDISDQDTPDLLTGKVASCANYGSVLAELNVGGIAGFIGMENDLDILEDWEQYGEESLNFESEVRAVVLNSENYGIVTGKKQNVGGIAGWQSLGLVKSCTNTGKVDGTDADYAGGISGSSTGFIRGSYAKCEIYADAYAGGIAGSATIVTDSLSQVKFTGVREKVGAILGWAEESETEVEDPISGNYYVCTEQDHGAIDGISYAGLAEPAELDAFLSMEALPEIFQTVTVRFLFEDGSVTAVPVTPGGTLLTSQVPALPQKEGYVGLWDGLENAELSNILFDMTFEAAYTAYRTTIESEQQRENGLPVLLAEGLFTNEAAVRAEASDAAPALAEEETLLEAWNIEINETVNTFRFLLPDDLGEDSLKLLACNEDGTWREVSFTQSGSYLVFALEAGEEQLALVQRGEDNTLLLIGGAGAVLLILLVAVIVLRGNHRKKKQAAEETEEVK